MARVARSIGARFQKSNIEMHFYNSRARIVAIAQQGWRAGRGCGPGTRECAPSPWLAVAADRVSGRKDRPVPCRPWARERYSGRKPPGSLDVGTPQRADRRYTYADSVSWPDEVRWELIDGAAFAMTPAPGWRHQELVSNLLYQLRQGRQAYFLAMASSCLGRMTWPSRAASLAE